jgi:hypothetical protein
MAPGRYASTYLRAVDPDRPRGAWIRHTTFARPGEPPRTALWCTVFDVTGPYAVKQSFGPAGEASGAAAGASYGWVTECSSRGRIEARGRRAAWELEIAGGAAGPLRHLGAGWRYRAPLPRTKLESPRPDAVFAGTIEAGDARIVLAGWRGMVGRNWGSEHAARWVWLHGTAFADEPGAWLDLALGRIRVAGRLSPWVANGALDLGGERHRLGGLRRRVEVDARPGALTAVVPGDGVTARIAVAAPAAATVAFAYADPGGGGHEVLNCSVAELHLRVERPGRPALELATAHGAAYELGLPPGTGHGVPLEPFPDP